MRGALYDCASEGWRKHCDDVGDDGDGDGNMEMRRREKRKSKSRLVRLRLAHQCQDNAKTSKQLQE